jgi:hypothetical protein
VVCGCLDLLVDGLGGYFLGLLRSPLEVVVDTLGGRMERIWNFGFDGVETFDRIVVLVASSRRQSQGKKESSCSLLIQAA